MENFDESKCGFCGNGFEIMLPLSPLLTYFKYFILYWESYFIKYENPVLCRKFKFPTAWIEFSNI